MGRRCELTGRHPRRGKSRAIRGIAKKDKGIGLNTTGTSKRRFLPNLLKKRIWDSLQKRWVRVKISAAGLRTMEKIGAQRALRRMGRLK